MKFQDKINLLIICVSSVLLNLLFASCVYPKDIEVVVEGFVKASYTELPIDSAKVTIVNERYQNDSGFSNYDEFLGKDIKTVYTDSTGYFHVIFKRGAYIHIEVIKDNYEIYITDGIYAYPNMKFEIQLNKIGKSQNL